MLQLGDEVVIMSAPGRFQVVAIDGLAVTIQNAEGIRKTVLESTLRRLAKRPSS